jgi:hypothetical protein
VFLAQGSVVKSLKIIKMEVFLGVRAGSKMNGRWRWLSVLCIPRPQQHEEKVVALLDAVRFELRVTRWGSTSINRALTG